MTKRTILSIGLSMAGALCALLGCEKDKSTGDMSMAPYSSDPRQSATPSVVVISPSLVGGTNVGETFVFTASGGNPPYRWDMQQNDLGRLATRGSDRNQGIYTVLKVGDNEIVVYDQDGQAGVAQIDGSYTTVRLVAVASPSTLAKNGDKSVMTASGGTPPYSWTVVDASLGHVVGSGTGNTVIYMRDHSGDNAITVTDHAGNVYHMVITQP